MAIKKSFAGQTISKPGSYSRGRVDNSAGSDIGSNDTVFLIGESSKGAPGSETGIVEYSASRLNALVQEFGEGPLVDCALTVTRPSTSPEISGAGRILVYKTNASTQASLVLNQSSDSFATVKDLAYGKDGNLLSVTVAAGSSAEQKAISIASLGGTTEALGENAAESIIQVTYTGDASTAVLNISGVSRSALSLSTTLAGDQTDGSANIAAIPLQGKTMKQLADQINAAQGYTATIVAVTKSANPATDLDVATAVDITSAVNLKRLQREIIDLINTSTRVEAVEGDLLAGVPDNISGVFLSGGAQGASANSDFSKGMAQSLSEEYNELLPCISRDAADDISDAELGFTDAASTYTIAAVVAAQGAHLALRGTAKNRKEAQGCFGVREAEKADAFSFIASQNDYNLQGFMQDMVFTNSLGNQVVGQPHILAAAAVGIRLGSPVGEPLTFKFVRSPQIGHMINPTSLLEKGDFNAGLDADEAIENGVTFAEKVGNGYRIVIDNTTYGIDNSFVYNRGSVIEATYFVYKTLRQTAETVFIGKKVSNGLAESIKNVVRNKLRELNADDVQIITASDDAPEGFREDTFVVTVNGNTAQVQVEFKPVQGLDFVFYDFTIGDIQQSA